MHDRRYTGLSYIEANNKCINDIKSGINHHLEEYKAFYTKATSDGADEVLKKYIALRKEHIIEKQLENFSFENVLSKFQFESLVQGRKLRTKCHDDAMQAWLECQDKFQEIDAYTINDVLNDVEKPPILLEWQSVHNSSSINVTDDFIHEYIESNYKMPYYNDEWCINQRNKALLNFDLNMKFYSMLDKEKYNYEIESFLKNDKEFIKVEDLNNFRGVAGVYIMLLDEYKQVYIGVSEKGIKERIQFHWLRKMPLDRLLFGGVYDSKISIDSFKHFDTTRLYVYPCCDRKKMYSKEHFLTEETFSNEFICNRCSGGGQTWEEAVGSIKKRDLKQL